MNVTALCVPSALAIGVLLSAGMGGPQANPMTAPMPARPADAPPLVPLAFIPTMLDNLIYEKPDDARGL